MQPDERVQEPVVAHDGGHDLFRHARTPVDTEQCPLARTTTGGTPPARARRAGQRNTSVTTPYRTNAGSVGQLSYTRLGQHRPGKPPPGPSAGRRLHWRRRRRLPLQVDDHILARRVARLAVIGVPAFGGGLLERLEETGAILPARHFRSVAIADLQAQHGTTGIVDVS